MTVNLASRPALRHHNAFDALRIIAALAVLYSHSFALYGLPEPAPLAGQTLGSLAVALFFSLSGYLVCQSWCSDPDVLRFTMRRALRIFPGLIVVVLMTACVIGLLVTNLSATEYLQSAEVYHFIVKGVLALGSPTLPGVFDQNPYPGTTNGSLWTLRYEIIMYIVLALTGKFFGRNHFRWACPLMFCVCALTWALAAYVGAKNVQIPLVWHVTELYLDRIAYLGAFFFAGACMLIYLDRVFLSRFAAIVAVGAVAFVPSPTIVMIMLWLIVPYVVCTIAFRSPDWMTKANGYDYSYGIYIYAFPIQQIFSLVGSQHRWTWLSVLASSALVTFLAAAASWYYVEKPALSFKHLIARVRVAPTAA